MTLICSVCGQDLELPMHSSREKCATKCGHIFHMECITNAWAPHIPSLLLVASRFVNRFLRSCYFPCPVCGTVTLGPYVMRVFPTSSAPAENQEAPQPVIGNEPIVEFVNEDGAPLNIGANGFAFHEQLEDISDLISRSGSGPGEAQGPAPEERTRDAVPGHSGTSSRSHSAPVQPLILGQNLDTGTTTELGEHQQPQPQQRKRQRVAAVGKGISKGKKQERKRK